jgi:hypothetical protein
VEFLASLSGVNSYLMIFFGETSLRKSHRGVCRALSFGT